MSFTPGQHVINTKTEKTYEIIDSSTYFDSKQIERVRAYLIKNGKVTRFQSYLAVDDLLTIVSER